MTDAEKILAYAMRRQGGTLLQISEAIGVTFGVTKAMFDKHRAFPAECVFPAGWSSDYVESEASRLLSVQRNKSGKSGDL